MTTTFAPGTTAPEGFQVETLEEVSGEFSGPLTPQNGGLQPTLWRGSSRGKQLMDSIRAEVADSNYLRRNDAKTDAEHVERMIGAWRASTAKSRPREATVPATLPSFSTPGANR